jgi:hypothetical protein
MILVFAILISFDLLDCRVNSNPDGEPPVFTVLRVAKDDLQGSLLKLHRAGDCFSRCLKDCRAIVAMRHATLTAVMLRHSLGRKFVEPAEQILSINVVWKGERGTTRVYAVVENKSRISSVRNGRFAASSLARLRSCVEQDPRSIPYQTIRWCESRFLSAVAQMLHTNTGCA